MNYEFLKEVLSGPWQIEPRTLNALYPIFRGMFNGLAIEQSPEPQNHRSYHMNADTRNVVMEDCEEDAPEVEVTESIIPKAKVINVLPIRSVLTKHDQMCGPVGTRTLANRLLEADGNENVIGHIIIAESGGGQSSAVPELTEAIQQCTKPIVVWVDGIAASAMYYIAAYCNEIIASRDMDFIGCIGTMSKFEGRKSKSEANEDGEISVTIYADGSDQKNEEFEVAINEFDFTLMKERILNPLNVRFQTDVKANRPQVLEEQLRGRTYFAQDVVGSLVDSIGPLSTAIDRVIALANYTKQPVAQPAAENQITNNPQIEMKQFPHLNSVLNVEALEATEEGAFLNEEQFASIEERLELNQQLVAERDTAVQELESANATLGTAQASIAAAYDPFNAIDPTVAAAETPEAKAEAVRTLLAARPGAAPIQTLTEVDDESIPVDADWELINNLPHNKLVDANS